MNESKDSANTIKSKVLSSQDYAKINSMTVEQKQQLINSKIKNIDKILNENNKVSYRKDISILLKSSNYLLIERLILDGFSQKSICDYIREILVEDEVLKKISDLTLKTSINKLKLMIDMQKVLPKMMMQDKSKGSVLEEKINNVIDEVSELSNLIAMQKERIVEMRNREISNNDYSKDMKYEIKLTQDLLKTSIEIKEKVGAIGNQNKDAYQVVKEGLKKDFSVLLNKDTSRKLRSLMSMILQFPTPDNVIQEDELSEVYPHNAPEVKALIEAKGRIKNGEFNSDEVFFPIERKTSPILADVERKMDDNSVVIDIAKMTTEQEEEEFDDELSKKTPEAMTDEEIMDSDGQDFEDETFEDEDNGEYYEDYDEEDEDNLDFED